MVFFFFSILNNEYFLYWKVEYSWGAILNIKVHFKKYSHNVLVFQYCTYFIFFTIFKILNNALKFRAFMIRNMMLKIILWIVNIIFEYFNVVRILISSIFQRYIILEILKNEYFIYSKFKYSWKAICNVIFKTFLRNVNIMFQYFNTVRILIFSVFQRWCYFWDFESWILPLLKIWIFMQSNT